MDEETLEILAGLNAAQPSTQQVDYSGFMQDFQPVQNYPNYFVPQQGLLQNTPVLDTLSDLDVMQQRPQSLLNMIDQYPTLESDFQRSFAVSPDTFNMNVYQRLPYDADYWNSFVNQGGGTSSSGVDLGAVIGGGLLASKLLGGDGDDGTTGGTDSGVNTSDITSVTTTLNNNDTIDGGIGTQTVEVTPTVETGILTNTILDNDTTEDGIGTQTEEISPTGNNLLTSTIIGGAGNDIIDDGIGSQTEETSGNITKNDALSIIETLTNNNTITPDNANNLRNTIEITNANFDTALLSGLTQIPSIGNRTMASNLMQEAQLSNQGLSSFTGDASAFSLPLSEQGNVNTLTNLEFDTQVNTFQNVIDAANLGIADAQNIINSAQNQLNNYGATLPDGSVYDFNAGKYIPQAEYNAIANPLKEQIANANANIDTLNTQISDANNQIDKIDFGGSAVTTGEPQGFIDKTFTKIGKGFQDFLNNPISDNIPITGDQVLTGVGTALALDQVIKDAKPSNVTAALAGGARLAGYTNPYTTPLIAGLTIAEQLAPPSSGKTGAGAFDYNTSTNTEFGMAGDKFKQGHVDTASTISQGIGTAVNTIAEGYGLNVEGDHLVEFGRERPLSITFGDQESEQKLDNRLNYNPETGDIINSNDDITRLYYTGQAGNDGSVLADNVIKATNLLSLKAVANDEDTINMKDFRIPAFSADKVKNQYLDMGLDETAANALTSASRSGSAATSELLGGLLVANTTNEDLFLTDAEKTSLLEKGYTEEQLDTILYG